MIFWEDYNEIRVSENSTISVEERTLLFKKNITSVEEEGTYACRSIDGRDISHSSLVVEYEAVRNVTNFTCVLYKSQDEFTCTWKLGLYHHPAYLKVSASVSMDNKGLVSCPQNEREECTWTSASGAINSVLKIVILIVTNQRYGVSETFRRVYTTRDITKYDPPKSIQVMNQNSTDCTCAYVSWEGISGGVDTSSRVTLHSKWETSYISVEVVGNTRVTVCDLVPASVYVVQVQVKSTGGKYYSDVNKTSFDTCSIAPSKAPSVNVSGYSSAKCPDSTSHRKVTVYWKKIPKRFQNGRLKNYTIFNGDVNVQVSPDSSFGEVEIPCKGSSNVTVKGCNDEGCSPESSITIPHIKEVILPTRVIVEHFNESTVKVSWFHTDGQAAVDIIWCNGRSGTLQCLDEIELQRMIGSDSHTFLSASDVNSKIDEVYFGVAIINDRQLSGGIKWQEACRYQMRREPMKILGVKLLPDAPENSLVISWSPVLCDASDINNVYVHSYEIIFCRLDSKNQCIGEESSVEVPATDNTQYTLRNLHSEVYYGVWVRARSLRENGPRSDMVSGIPINNDLSTSAITGIVVAGIFVFILVMAGGVFIFRNVRRKLGLDETFPIHLPTLEFKTGETNLSTHDNGIKSPFCISSDSKELSGLSQSGERVNVLFTTQETLIKFLKGNPTNKPINTNYDTPLAPTDDVPNKISGRKGGDEESVSARLAKSTPASPILRLGEKQDTSKAEAKEVLPPDYAKATIIALTCLNDIESSPLKEEIGTYISPLNSNGNTPEPTFSGDYNEKQNDVNAQIWKKDYTEEKSTTSPQYYRDNQSFNNDGSYVTNDSRYWNTGNESEQCQKDLFTTTVRQSMDSSMSEEMSENIMDDIKSTILKTTNINANVSTLDTETSTSNQMDYVSSDFCPPDDVHNDSKCTSDLRLTPHTDGDSYDSNNKLANEFKQSVEMWGDYVPNDIKAALDSNPGDTMNQTV
ncbi:uncharacterized protein LOC134243489 isoform X2 [Saccostrea cucullata]